MRLAIPVTMDMYVARLWCILHMVELHLPEGLGKEVCQVNVLTGLDSMDKVPWYGRKA